MKQMKKSFYMIMINSQCIQLYRRVLFFKQVYNYDSISHKHGLIFVTQSDHEICNRRYWSNIIIEMAWCLIGNKPLSEPMLNYWWLDHMEQMWNLNWNWFSFGKMSSGKCRALCRGLNVFRIWYLTTAHIVKLLCMPIYYVCIHFFPQ